MKPKAKRLSAEEEVALARRAKTDVKARNELASSMYDYIVLEASKLSRRTAPAEDLVQEGMLGAMHAVRKFDPERGIRFSTYAAHWIRAYMWRFVGFNRSLLSGTRRLSPCRGNQKLVEQRLVVRTEPIDEHTNLSHGAFDPEQLDCESVGQLLELANLTHQELWLIEQRFMNDEEKPISFSDAGKELGYSRQWARKIEARAMKKLRRAAKSKLRWEVTI